MIRRRLLVVLLALAAAFGGPGLARADSGADLGLAPDANAAIAINTTDGSDLFKFAFSIRHVMSDVVDQQNAAIAYSQCSSCQTTAIAIQIVLVEGTPTTVAPENVAVSINQGCTLCDTFASAYQFVVGTGGPVHFTQEGLRELHAIREEIKSWRKQDLSNAEIRSRLPALIARLKLVLKNELVPDGKSGERGSEPDESDTTETHGQSTHTTPTPTATSESGSETTTTPATTTDGTTTTAPTTTTEPTTTTTTP